MTPDSYNSFAYGSNLRDYIASLLLALLFHVCLLTIMVGLWRGNPTRARPMFPYGESSLAMTFVVPPSAEAVTMQSQEAPPVAAPFFTEPVVEEEAPVLAAIPDPRAQPQESQPAPQSDADGFSKGIQGLPRMSAGVRPVYPLGARHRGEQGNVTVRVQVGADGRVKGTAIARSSNHLELDQAALKALRRACFVPARSDGKPVASESLIIFRFQLLN